MKLATVKENRESLLVVQHDLGLISVQKAIEEVGSFDLLDIPQTIMDLVEAGSDGVEKLRTYIEALTVENESSYLLSENEVEWEPCILRPQKIICVGLNYRKHADETKLPYPEYPILFNKYANALTGHNQVISIPRETKKVDYEVELAIIIGKEAKDVPEEKALDYVFGYCSGNDLSARDLQMRTPQWMLGKTSDGFCPIGPFAVTADEIPDPNHLRLTTKVNGELRQDSNTSDMIFNCKELIAYISKHMTLYPGDLILTGTPSGVILGYPEDKQQYLQPGDEVIVEVEKLGALRNTFV
ncbi:fumarylacetoacetate hydrolase family protein [Bacillaceae bacterium S4-13-58]